MRNDENKYFNFVHFDEERYKNAMTPEEFQAKFGIVREKLSHTVSENLLSSRLPRSLIEHLPKTSKRLLDAVRWRALAICRI